MVDVRVNDPHNRVPILQHASVFSIYYKYPTTGTQCEPVVERNIYFMFLYAEIFSDRL